MNTEERYRTLLEGVSRSYDLVIMYHLNENKETKLSNAKKPQECRFCGRKSPEVKFSKIAHAISHMVENRSLKSDYECDECNELFAKYESDYSSYMNLYHTMFKVHGKGGIPKYKLNSKQNSKIEVDTDSKIRINIHEGEEPLIKWDDEDKANNSIKIKGKRTYTPQNVLRAIVKMALTVMPESELPNLGNTMNWLMGKPCSGIVMPVHIRFYRTLLPFTSVAIFKRKENQEILQPSYVMLLAYKNIVIQAPLPMVEKDEPHAGKNSSLPLFPTPLDEHSIPFMSRIAHLSGTEKVKGEDVTIELKYDSFEETFPGQPPTD